MKDSSIQPEKDSDQQLNEAEATLAGDLEMPSKAATLEEFSSKNPKPSEATATASESSLGDTDNSHETILSESDHFPAGSPAKSEGQRASDDVEFPSEFGRYAITRQLGRGAMGAVFLARDNQLNRDVALKVPTFTDKSPPNMIERFYREARSAATLTHPNICPVYDVGEHDGTHFISMAYIEGRPLSAYIDSGKKQPERQAAAVVRKLALALQEAHDKGIVHRDLKPANIMINLRSEPIVMDFGLARLTNDTEEAKLTREGTVMGSPAYMSPEQVEGKNIGPLCDVYSLGIVFYELLTGQTPYQGTVMSVIGQILAAQPKDPRELRADISPGCSAICLKAIASDRFERFQSMADFAQALNAFIKGDSKAIDTFVELASGDGRLTIDELKKQKNDVVTLLEKKHYRDAISALETLSEQEGQQAADYVAWAKKQLPNAREDCKKMTEESKSLYRRAKKRMATYDYERAAQHLEQIPADLRNHSVSDLIAEADDLVDEVRRLSDDVEHAVRSGVNDGMQTVVERLLELKPQHRQANDLYEELYSSARESRPTHRKKKTAAAKIDSRIIAGAVAVIALIGLFMFWPDDNSQTGDDGAGENNAATGQAGGDADTNGDAATSQPKRVDLDDDVSDEQYFRELLRDSNSPTDLFRKLDTNDNGVLVKGEVKLRFIKRADMNGDGEITIAEARAVFDRFVGRPPQPMGDGRGYIPPRNPDGPLVDDPRFDGPPNDPRQRPRRGRGPEKPEDIFYRHDTNDDGVLTGSEIPPFFSDQLDLNGDSEITLQELHRAMKDLGRAAFDNPPDGGGGRRRPLRP